MNYMADKSRSLAFTLYYSLWQGQISFPFFFTSTTTAILLELSV